MEPVERVYGKGRLLACIIRSEWAPEQTTFISSEDQNFQLGCFVYSKGQEVARHSHVPIARAIEGTQEFLLVRKGRCVVDLYDEERNKVKTVELRPGDAILFFAGGHGFRLLEDTAFLDLKQGPYPGPVEKERF